MKNLHQKLKFLVAATVESEVPEFTFTVDDSHVDATEDVVEDEKPARNVPKDEEEDLDRIFNEFNQQKLDALSVSNLLNSFPKMSRYMK